MLAKNLIDNTAVSAERCSVFNSAIDITRAMLEQAGQQQWDTMAELELKRRGLLESLFEPMPAASEAQALANGLQSLLQMDAEIVLLTEQARQSCKEQLKQLSQGRQAIDAYQKA